MRKTLLKFTAGMGMAAILFLGWGFHADAATYADLFDADYYAKKNPDVVEVYGNDPNILFSHYMNLGIHEGRNAGPLFDVKAYRRNNSDLEGLYADNWAAYVNHYLSEGLYEGRIGYGEAFDAAAYVSRYSDLKNVFGYDLVKLYTHYLKHGIKEGRNASFEFTDKEKAAQSNQKTPLQSLSGHSVPRKARRLFEIVNEERTAWGIKKIAWDNTLAELAETRAMELSLKFDHIRPNGTSVYEYMVDEEIISMWYRDEEKVHNALMNDPGTGYTIIDSSLTKIGIACYEVGGIYYWCELFKE